MAASVGSYVVRTGLYSDLHSWPSFGDPDACTSHIAIFPQLQSMDPYTGDPCVRLDQEPIQRGAHLETRAEDSGIIHIGGGESFRSMSLNTRPVIPRAENAPPDDVLNVV